MSFGQSTLRAERVVLVSITSALTLLLLLGSSCNLVAGLNDFQPPGPSTGTAESSGATSGEGGATGVTSSSGSMTNGVTSSASGNPQGSSGSVGSGGAGSCADHLLINEVRIQDGDFVELYNPTSSAMNLEGLTVHAKTGNTSLGVKWTGKAGATLSPQGFYLLAVSGGDDLLSGIVMTDPTVVVLDSPSMQVIDSMCVCTSQTPCTFTDGVTEFCTGKALIAANFHVAGDITSAQRKSCDDSDNSEIDFGTGCPTPSEPNFSVPSCQ